MTYFEAGSVVYYLGHVFDCFLARAEILEILRNDASNPQGIKQQLFQKSFAYVSPFVPGEDYCKIKLLDDQGAISEFYSPVALLIYEADLKKYKAEIDKINEGKSVRGGSQNHPRG